MSVSSCPKVWSRNLSEELESESKRSRLIEKQRQLLETKKSRQQQVKITATRPKSARTFTSPSGSTGEVVEDVDKKKEKPDQGSNSRPSSSRPTSRTNSSSAKPSSDKQGSPSSPEISPVDSPEIRVKRPTTVYASSRYDGLIRSKSISEMKNEVELIRDLELGENNHELNPLKSILNNNELLLFATQPVPERKTYQCVIIRDKRGLDRSFYPTYYIHLQAVIDKNHKSESESSSPTKSSAERGHSADSDRKKSCKSASVSTRSYSNNRRQVFLLGGRRRKKSKTYLIRNDPFDITRDNCIAKLKSNVLGTQFNAIQTSSDGRRYEVATIIYETNVLGFKGPRKMTVLIPRSQEVLHRAKTHLIVLLIQAFYSPTLSLLDVWKNNPNIKDQKSVIALKNKTPSWNEDTQSYVLNFHGRVTQASVKNFQLVVSDQGKSESSQIVDVLTLKTNRARGSSGASSTSFLTTNPEPNSRSESVVSLPLDDDIAMQFGRISDKEFTCDVNFPLSILQAFCIALSSFDSKLACE